MPPETPAPRRQSSRRAPAQPTKIPIGLPIGKIAPYVLAGAAVAVLITLIRTPRYSSFGGFGIGVVITCTLGYLAMLGRQNLAPDDRLRNVLLPVTLLAMAGALVPFGYTVFPPAPQGEVVLAHAGDSASVTVHGAAINTWVTVRAGIVSTAVGDADYYLTVTHDGGASEPIDGRIRPHKGGPLPDRHALHAHGSGTYTLRLEQASSAVALPMHVDVRARPFSFLLLLFVYAGLAILVIAVDVALWRRNVEPAFAACLMLPLVAVLFFQRVMATDTVPSDLLAAGLVGALGGGLGGEVLARGARMFVSK